MKMKQLRLHMTLAHHSVSYLGSSVTVICLLLADSKAQV